MVAAMKHVTGGRLVAVMRRTPTLAHDFCRRFQASRYYTTIQSLVADKEVDAIYIAAPTGLDGSFRSLISIQSSEELPDQI